MEDVFELSKFDEYKEDNRREVKAAEAIANCLVNADYFQRWSVVIERYPDRIVLSNPGTIIPGKKQMLRGGISEPRNRNLFKMFNLIGIGEHAGSGVPDIFDVWESEGLETPTVEEQFGAGLPDRTTLTLPLINKMKDLSEMKQDFLPQSPEKSPEKSPETKANEIDARKEAVLSLIMENPSLSKSKIARKLGISDRQVRTVLDYLKAEGKIHYEGTSRGGRWVID